MTNKQTTYALARRQKLIDAGIVKRIDGKLIKLGDDEPIVPVICPNGDLSNEY